MRVRRPAIRRNWLEHGSGAATELGGREDFVEVDWPVALSLMAKELQRVRTEHGNSAIFGESYGWSSAGRFHHAQSQVHYFLNTISGYVRHVDTYSLGAERCGARRFSIFSDLSGLLGTRDVYTKGLDEQGWLQRIYDESAVRERRAGVELPDFAKFWQAGLIDLSGLNQPRVLPEGFRWDPEARRLTTPLERSKSGPIRSPGSGSPTAQRIRCGWNRRSGWGRSWPYCMRCT